MLRSGRTAASHGVIHAGRARRRIRRWRSQNPFTDSFYFSQRLASDGITEGELLRVLGEPHEAIAARLSDIPAWLTELDEAYETSGHVANGNFPLPAALREHKTSGFLEMIAPLMARGRNRLRAGLETIKQRYPDAPYETASTLDALCENLPSQLIRMLAPTLVLELNVARLQGMLSGDTSEERFESFVQYVRGSNAAVSILQNYPALAHQLVLRINKWVDFGLQFIEHLAADWSEIQLTLGVQTSLLSRVHGGLGDTHNGGKAVLMVEFESGWKLVYKPRSMAVDQHFQELLAWLNEQGSQPPFHTLRILDYGNHGWSEYVASSGCETAEELVRFYERQGGYLALLYALEAVDFHYENLIASGEHPVLVDLESLFHPRVVQPDLSDPDLLAADVIDHSVLRVGLLPRRIWSEGDQEGIDLSGLGAAGGQMTPEEVPYWEGGGTDQMHIARRRMAIKGASNRPQIDGVEVNALDYGEAIVAGFTRTYQLLIDHRDELLSDDGPLTRFANDPVRILLRPTRTYGELLHGSFHPDFLGDALERDRHFDQLWIGIEPDSHLTKVISAEREALHGGDIPMFTTLPNSRAVWPNAGEPVKDFLDQPGMTLVRRRLELMGERDLTRQLWFIRASLTTLSVGKKESLYRLTESHGEVDRDRLIDAARSVGDRLEELALSTGDEATWIGLTLSSEGSWALAPLGVSTYDGVSGIALFLGHLGAITSEARYESLAQAALRTVRRRVKQESTMTSVGGFAGWGGIIYTFAHLGALWNQPARFDEAKAIVKFLPDLIERDEDFDIVGGSAGCIAGLLSLYRCAPSEDVLAAAVRCGDKLLECARPAGSSLGWTGRSTTGATGGVSLAGFSHGAAGIASALLELSAITREARFRSGAVKAIEYERSIFSPAEGNWPDLREAARKSDEDRFMVAWCHGAPGVGLARLRSLSHLDDEKIREEVDIAVRTTLDRGFGRNHSLCHGDLGNLDLILQASEELDLSSDLNLLAATILESVNQNGWICGTPQGVETPGLMIGLAGIGYGLLRLAEPVRVPSVLVLAPPKC